MSGEAVGFGGAVGFGRRPAVVVVDLIEGFTDPVSPLGSDLDAVVAATRRVLDHAREAEVPVIFTTVSYDEGAETAAAAFLRKVPSLAILRPGSRWIRVDERLGRRPEEPLVVKPFASSFFATPLASMLAGRDTVVVCGASTSGCVRATVVDAVQHNLAAVVPVEAVGDRWRSAHDAALFDIGQKYGDVMGLDEVMVALGGSRAP